MRKHKLNQTMTHHFNMQYDDAKMYGYQDRVLELNGVQKRPPAPNPDMQPKQYADWQIGRQMADNVVSQEPHLTIDNPVVRRLANPETIFTELDRSTE